MGVNELKPGEKYLRIHLLGNELKLSAFPNKERENSKQPHFKGYGVSVWVCKKKEPKREDSCEEFI